MKKIKWHLIGIFVYSVYVLSLDILYYKKFYFSSELSALLAEIWVFYSGYSILHFLFLTHKKKKLYSIPALIISLIGAYFAVLLNDWINFYYNKAKFSQSRVIYDTSQVYTHFFIYAIGYFFVERSIQKQKQLRLAEQQKAEAEQQKVEIEKAKLQIENENLRLQDDFLRAQINPHFLYNCLNFFYTQTFQTHANVAEAVLMLSDIMRYSLKDYSTTNGLANLSEEITHIENVINIHQLRFAGTLQINFKVEGIVEGKLVSPMVLITLVENIFKHGDLHDKNNVALIYCSIDNTKQTIYFATHNKKKTGTYEGSTGIGLNNIKQRLQSLYKDNFRMDTTDEETMYKKEITLPYFYQRSHQAAILNINPNNIYNGKV